VRWSLLLFLFFGAWSAVVLGDIIKLNEPYLWIVRVFPLWLLVAFGCYSLGTIAYKLMTFNDCLDEAKSLEKERKTAIQFLKSKGIDIKSD